MRKPVGLTAPYRKEDDDDTQEHKRTWVPLTDAEFAQAAQAAERGNYLVAFHLIQKKLKEKNT